MTTELQLSSNNPQSDRDFPTDRDEYFNYSTVCNDAVIDTETEVVLSHSKFYEYQNDTFLNCSKNYSSVKSKLGLHLEYLKRHV